MLASKLFAKESPPSSEKRTMGKQTLTVSIQPTQLHTHIPVQTNVALGSLSSLVNTQEGEGQC